MEIHTPRMGWQLATFTFTRLVVSTAFRMVYPFLGVIARGLGVTVDSIAYAVSLRSALGVLAPLMGSISDIQGRRLTLVYSLVLFAGSMLIIDRWPSYSVLFVGLILSGIANIVIDATIQAYIGDQVPYERRGRAIAVVESGWSLAFVAGIPVVGWSIAKWGWSSPFAWLGFMGLALGGMVWFQVSTDERTTGDLRMLVNGLRKMVTQKSALMGLLFSFTILSANQLVNIMFGVWMEREFGLHIEQLGAASAVIGFAGILGVVMVALFTDKLGKRWAIGLGLIVNSIASLALPLLGRSLTGALTSLFVFYLSFEFTLTSAISLMTELVPLARGTFVAANMAAISLGDSIGALAGTWLMRIGLTANAFTAGALDIIALAILIFFVDTAKMDTEFPMTSIPR